ncbi:hypothetical protein [Ottowia massiliensis]|uniref:hypothetical protein n=1 Tax=Ottowia massiliensis TaxID=2045302 RepID=UPI0013041201|nr:hypothetical protein [Ottowia massiliensis]
MKTALVAINTGSFRYQTRSKKVEQEASLLPFASPTAFPFSPPSHAAASAESQRKSILDVKTLASLPPSRANGHAWIAAAFSSP